MPQPEPKNPFYFVLLLASLAFVITALAYAVVPTLEQRAIDARHRRADAAPLASSWRDTLREDGWKWLLGELAAMIVFGFLSMALDRLRSLQKERAANTMPAADPARPLPETPER